MPTVHETVISIIKDVMAEETINENKSISELGGDSLDVIDMVFRLEEEFDIEFSIEEEDSITTIKQVIDYCEKKVAEKA